MPLSTEMQGQVLQLHQPNRATSTPVRKGKAVQVKRGEEILAGTDYPVDWASFVGQEQAKRVLSAHRTSCQERGTRLDHTLLASGLHGVGKSALAHLLAYEAGVGMASVSGPVTLDEARRVLGEMQDNDVLFWDEIHNAVVGGKAKIEWTLPFMTDGVLLTAQGALEVPDVTIVAATTDAGRLPQTLLSRFKVRPRLMPYTPAEAEQIALSMAKRIDSAPGAQPFWFGIESEFPHAWKRIAQAASRNPRGIATVLTMVRDVYTSGAYVQVPWEAHETTLRPGHESDAIAVGIDWAGFSYDGLDNEARDMLQVLLLAADYTASIDTIAAQLGEPGPLRHSEQLLLQKGFVTITGRGRKLTDTGIDRALLLASGIAQDPTVYDDTWY